MQVSKNGKPSLTRYKVIKRFKKFCYLEVYPQTGRTHQIRVHLKEIQCPLAVDPLYGNINSIDISQIKLRYFKKDAFEENHPLMSRLTLHAYAIQFQDPFSKQTRHFEAPPPKDFSALLKALQKWNAI
jgi:23S rRNA pseudouridine955/2504/2580 synthase/23S rRNA pseudouridine1911/1915/1917 synthase